MAKRIISACVDRIIEFDTPQEAKAYLDGMKKADKIFRIQYDEDAGGGKRRLRIQEQYNKNPLIREGE